MKKSLTLNKTYFIIGAILLIVGSIFILKNKVFNNDYDVKLSCNNNFKELSDSNKKEIDNYMKTEKLKKNSESVKCMPTNQYVLYYKEYEVTFDDTDCSTYFYNNKTKENYQTTIKDDLKNYIKNICK